MLTLHASTRAPLRQRPSLPLHLRRDGINEARSVGLCFGDWRIYAPRGPRVAAAPRRLSRFEAVRRCVLITHLYGKGQGFAL